jgi:uncharacterized membrane protein YqiK
MTLVTLIYGMLGIVVGIVVIRYMLGIVRIREDQVGIVVKKFSSKPLAAGSLIALNGEAGYQAETLPPGLHFGYWVWQYQVEKIRMTVVPSGEIALVLAMDGAAISSNRILGKAVECNSFQDAAAFLKNGGEKGRQLGILTAGTYRINTALFQVITVRNAAAHDMKEDDLHVYQVQPDKVGVVTTLDGMPIDAGEIAGPVVAGHDNFQNGQAFIDGGGRRGLQEQILLSGSWNLNPWFVRTSQVAMTEIPIGHVGVVISFVGKPHVDISGVAFKHGDLVEAGHKGVWITPLYPGKHPLNTSIMSVELVPTTNIVLNWANRTESHHYDAKLSSITVRSCDGFGFSLDVSQVIHVGALDAPKVISRVGSMQNLVDHVLQPIVGNYFRNSAQSAAVLKFLSDRTERQKEAAAFIREALRSYDVQAIDTLIGDINPPADLMQTQTDRKIAAEQEQTYKVQETTQKQRQLLMKEMAIADIQSSVVKAQQGVQITELEAQAAVKRAAGESDSLKLRAAAEGERVKYLAAAESESVRLRASAEAEATRATGSARAEAYAAGVKALGAESYAALQLMQVVGEKAVKIVPDISVTSSGNAGLAEGLLATLLKK